MAIPNISKFVIQMPDGTTAEYTPADLAARDHQAINTAMQAIFAKVFEEDPFGSSPSVPAPTNIEVHVNHRNYDSFSIVNLDDNVSTEIRRNAKEFTTEEDGAHFNTILNTVHDAALGILLKRPVAAPMLSPSAIPGMHGAYPAGPNVYHISCGCSHGHGGGGANAAIVMQLQLINGSLDRLGHTVEGLTREVTALIERRGPRPDDLEESPRHRRDDRRDVLAGLQDELGHAHRENEELRRQIERSGQENELRFRRALLEAREELQGPLHQAQEEVTQMRAQLRRDREDFQRALQQEQHLNREALRPLAEGIDQLTAAQRTQLRANAQLQGQLAETHALVEPLQGRVEALTEELTQQGRAAQEQFEALRDANAELRDQLAETTALVQPLRGRVEDLQEQLADQGRAAQEQLQAIRDELQAQRRLSAGALRRLRQENAALRELVEGLREELQGDREQNAGAIQRLDRIYDEHIATLRDQLETVEAAGQVLGQLRADAVEELDAERDANAQLRQEIERLGHQHEEAIAQVQAELQAQHEQEIERLRTENLHKLIQASHRARGALQQQAIRIHAKNQRALQALQDRNQTLQREIERQQEAIRQANLNAERLQQQLTQAGQQIRDLPGQLNVPGLLDIGNDLQIDEEEQ